MISIIELKADLERYKDLPNASPEFIALMETGIEMAEILEKIQRQRPGVPDDASLREACAERPTCHACLARYRQEHMKK